MAGPVLDTATRKELALVAAHRRAMESRRIVYVYALGPLLSPPSWVCVSRGGPKGLGELLRRTEDSEPPILVAMIAFDPNALAVELRESDRLRQGAAAIPCEVRR